MLNSTLEAIFNRRSVRAYTDREVDSETADLLARAALAAPSGSNQQPVNVIVVRNKALILELEKAVVDHFIKIGDQVVAERNKQRGNKIFYNASTVFFLAVANDKTTDVGIAAENIVIAASSLGLGSIHLGLPHAVFRDPATADPWKARIGFPPGYEYGLAVAVGYAADEGKPHDIDPAKISHIF